MTLMNEISNQNLQSLSIVKYFHGNMTLTNDLIKIWNCIKVLPHSHVPTQRTWAIQFEMDLHRICHKTI